MTPRICLSAVLFFLLSANGVAAEFGGRGRVSLLIAEVERILGKELVLPTDFDSEREVDHFKVSAEDLEVEVELVLFELGLAVQSKEEDRWILEAL